MSGGLYLEYGQAAFFGHMGVAIALGMASNVKFTQKHNQFQFI